MVICGVVLIFFANARGSRVLAFFCVPRPRPIIVMLAVVSGATEGALCQTRFAPGTYVAFAADSASTCCRGGVLETNLTFAVKLQMQREMAVAGLIPPFDPVSSFLHRLDDLRPQCHSPEPFLDFFPPCSVQNGALELDFLHFARAFARLHAKRSFDPVHARQYGIHACATGHVRVRGRGANSRMLQRPDVFLESSNFVPKSRARCTFERGARVWRPTRRERFVRESRRDLRR